MQGVPELAQGLDLATIGQGRISTIQVVAHELLASQFAERGILQILGNQIGGISNSRNASSSRFCFCSFIPWSKALRAS